MKATMIIMFSYTQLQLYANEQTRCCSTLNHTQHSNIPVLLSRVVSANLSGAKYLDEELREIDFDSFQNKIALVIAAESREKVSGISPKNGAILNVGWRQSRTPDLI